MDLLIDHPHNEPSQPPFKSKPKKQQFSQKAQTSKYFKEELAKTEVKLNQDTKINITKMRQLRQKKIYANLGISPLQQLFILFQERRHKLKEPYSQAMEDVLNKRNKSVLSQLRKEQITIHKPKTILQIKEELNQNLELLRAENSTLKIPKASSPDIKQIDKYSKRNQEFRQKSYWKTPNEKSESVRSFIKIMRQKQNLQQKKYEKMLKEQQTHIQERQLSLQRQRQLKHRQLKEELHRSFTMKKQQRLKEVQADKKKSEEVEKFLQKFKEKPPNYILFSERYKKRYSEQEKERKEFLQKLKESKRHSSLSQMRDQMQKHRQLRQMHQMSKIQERQQEEQKQNEIKQKLQELYKSKKYERYIKNQSAPIDQNKIREQKMIKMILYSKKAQAQHTPKVNEEKRQQLLQEIEELAKKQDHKIRKLRDGEQIVIDKAQLDPRKIGLEYLEQIKKMASQIERKPAPEPERKEQKILDRSLLKNEFYNKKITISNWKEIIQNEKLTQFQKNQKIDIFLKLAEEKKLQNSYQKRNSNLQRSIHLQEQIDHYEIEKTEAKLALLKNLK